MIVVDTNILIYASSPSYELEYEPCRDFLTGLAEGVTPWYLTWPIVYEFLRVVTHRGIHATPVHLEAAWEYVQSLIDAESSSFLLPTSRHLDRLKELALEIPTLSGSVLHDAHTVVLMREHGVRKIATRDRDFHLFDDLQIVDPLRNP